MLDINEIKLEIKMHQVYLQQIEKRISNLEVENQKLKSIIRELELGNASRKGRDTVISFFIGILISLLKEWVKDRNPFG